MFRYKTQVFVFLNYFAYKERTEPPGPILQGFGGSE